MSVEIDREWMEIEDKGFDYDKLTKCKDCEYPASKMAKQQCSLQWRPGTGTKTGFPTEDGWECPRDTCERKTYTFHDLLKLSKQARARQKQDSVWVCADGTTEVTDVSYACHGIELFIRDVFQYKEQE